MQVTVNTEDFHEALRTTWSSALSTEWRWAVTATVLAVVLPVWRSASRALRPHLSLRLRKMVGVVILLPVALLLFGVWEGGLPQGATALGLVAAAGTVALTTPIRNFAAYLYILLRRPFAVGDLISVGPWSGIVESIEPQRTELTRWEDDGVGLAPLGGRVLLTNGNLLDTTVLNHDHDGSLRRVPLEMVLTLGSDIDAGLRLLQDVAQQHGLRLEPPTFPDLIRSVPEDLMVDLLDHGIRLTLPCWLKVREARPLLSRARVDLVQRVSASPSLELAYPSLTVYRQTS